MDYINLISSEISPIIEIEIEEINSEILSNLNEIASNESVSKIYVYTEEISPETYSPVFEIEGDTGDGGSGGQGSSSREIVSVGIVDILLPSEPQSCEYIHGNNQYLYRSSFYGHEGQVAFILQDSYDDQNYLNICYASWQESGSLIPAVNGLISHKDVDIIVLAIGDSYDAYSPYSEHLDYVSWFTGVTIVAATSNRGLTEFGGDYLVTSTATGYNVIGVGGITLNGSFWEGSSYIYTNDIISKPNIVDYVEFPSNNFGTSFSAPRAAAKIAMFLSNHPEFKKDNISILSFVHSASSSNDIIVDNNSFHLSGLSNKIGAGIIKLEKLNEIITFESFYRVSPIEISEELPEVLLSFNVYIHLHETFQLTLSSMNIGCSLNNHDMTEYEVNISYQGNKMSEVNSTSNILHLKYSNNVNSGVFNVKVLQKTQSVCHSQYSDVVVSYIKTSY